MRNGRISIREKYQKLDNESWLKRNNIEKNEDYIYSLLENSVFEKFNIMRNCYGDCSLELTLGLDEFKIEVSEEECVYKISKRNKALNPRQKEKYRYIKDFKCDDICEIIEYIKNKDKKSKIIIKN